MSRDSEIAGCGCLILLLGLVFLGISAGIAYGGLVGGMLGAGIMCFALGIAIMILGSI